MNVDYQQISTEVFAIDNCEVVDAPEFGSGPVVNVDANFVVPKGMTDQDMTSHRLHQMREMINAAENFGPLPTTTFDPSAKRKPTSDHLSEWRNLKRAISTLCKSPFASDSQAAKLMVDPRHLSQHFIESCLIVLVCNIFDQ
ncbi:hypothetical protein, partial [Profundibacter sp.]